VAGLPKRHKVCLGRMLGIVPTFVGSQDGKTLRFSTAAFDVGWT